MNRDAATTQVADLSKFLKSHPVAKPDPGDFEPDGTWYSMVAVRGNLYAAEPNHGESMTAPGLPGPGELGTGKVVRIDPCGTQTVIAAGPPFPAAITLGPDGALYVPPGDQPPHPPVPARDAPAPEGLPGGVVAATSGLLRIAPVPVPHGDGNFRSTWR